MDEAQAKRPEVEAPAEADATAVSVAAALAALRRHGTAPKALGAKGTEPFVFSAAIAGIRSPAASRNRTRSLSHLRPEP